MNDGLLNLRALLAKDLKVEARTGAHLLPFMSVSLILVTILGLGCGGFVHDQALRDRIYHPLIWSVFVFTGSLTLLRVFEGDRRAQTIPALLLFRRSLLSFYFAKVLFIVLALSINQLVSSLLLAALLDVQLSNWLVSFLILTLFVSVGYASLGGFIGAIVSQHQKAHILFPLVFLPLLFPIFFSVLEVSFILSTGGGLLAAADWLSLIVGLTTIYLVTATLLFEQMVKE